MDTTNNEKHSKLFTVMISLMMSFVFMASPPFERNPQQCEMVREIEKNKNS